MSMLENSPSHEQTQQILSAIVIGDVRVGKTTLVRQACKNNQSAKIVPTIGIEFGAMNLEHQCKQFRIKFWDLCTDMNELAGQKKYQSLLQSYIERCNIAIIVFDLTNFQSFHNAKEWVSEINSNYEDIYVILFGNKKDLYDRNSNANTCVPHQTIRPFVDETGVIYEEGCALSDDKLTQALKKIIERNFLPNDLILEGANQAKSCGCFC